MLSKSDGRTRPLLFSGQQQLPSAVCASPDGSLLVGRAAVYTAQRYPESFEPHPKKHLDEGNLLLGGREWPVAEVVGAVLAHVAAEADRVTGYTPVDEVVLTHPAVWARSRRRVLVDAAARAGWRKVRLIPEPLSAAAAFVADHPDCLPAGSTALVYDLGAGTFDATVVRAEARGGYSVLASDGLADAGGLDVDHAIVTYLAAVFSRYSEQWTQLEYPESSAERRARWLFLDDVRTAKELLATTAGTFIRVPFLEDEIPLGREQLDQLCRPLIDRTLRSCRAVVRDAGLTADDLHAVFLVGGATRLPGITQNLHRALNHSPIVLDQPELVVATGCLQADLLASATGSVTRLIRPPGLNGSTVRLPAMRDAATVTRPARRPSEPALPPQRPISPAPPRSPGASQESPAEEPHAPEGRAAQPRATEPRATEPRATEPRATEARAGQPRPAERRTTPATMPPVARPAIAARHRPRRRRLTTVTLAAASAVAVALAVCLFVVLGDNDVNESRILTDPGNRIRALAFHRDGRILASGGLDGTIQLWDVASGERVGKPLAGHTEPITALAFSPNGTVLASGSRDGSIRLWNVDTRGPYTNPLIGQPSAVLSVAFDPSGEVLASGSLDGALQRWNVDSAKQAATPLVVNGKSVVAVAYSPDGTFLAAAVDGGIKLWSKISDQPTAELITGTVQAIAFGADGVLVAGVDNDVSIWDLDRIGPEKRLTGHTGTVYAVDVSPDGTTIASGSLDYSVRLWETASGEQVGEPLTGHSGTVYAVAFSPDGRTLASGSDDGTIRLWQR
ncbi:Hsp70 family protein [Cryptosporangium sp. NPDC048952]|uniref:Hsp70 family protein n=1 Tax=Cryptosporangium sp. NPDC048952 TaxID=3363961 RepID=UPI003710440A